MALGTNRSGLAGLAIYAGAALAWLFWVSILEAVESALYVAGPGIGLGWVLPSEVLLSIIVGLIPSWWLGRSAVRHGIGSASRIWIIPVAVAVAWTGLIIGLNLTTSPDGWSRFLQEVTFSWFAAAGALIGIRRQAAVDSAGQTMATVSEDEPT